MKANSAENQRPVFLTAEWRKLVMLNWVVDPGVLEQSLPQGVELDDFEGRHYISLVAFTFLDTRIKRIPIPFHRDFEEVNLRFYVKREMPDGVRRGVVFLKEIVPRRAIAAIANLIYGENYVRHPMHRELEFDGDRGLVRYGWQNEGDSFGVFGSWDSTPVLPAAGSEEEFISEHYWGYARRRGGGTTEYQVEHPQWTTWPEATVGLNGDFTKVYGSEFGAILNRAPYSAFVADGSPIVVRSGTRIA